MTEINNRIGKILERPMKFVDKDEINRVGELWLDDKEKLARQICQLFPQPLDDKELREKIAELTDVQCDCCKYSAGSNHPEDCFDTPETTPCKRRLDIAGLILTLLQPKIAQLMEESEARREIIRRLIARCEQLIDQLKLADKNHTELKSAFDERIEEARRQVAEEIREELKKCGWFVDMGDGRWGEQKAAWNAFWEKYIGGKP